MRSSPYVSRVALGTAEAIALGYIHVTKTNDPIHARFGTIFRVNN
jgi:hypothetical protein